MQPSHSYPESRPAGPDFKHSIPEVDGFPAAQPASDMAAPTEEASAPIIAPGTALGTAPSVPLSGAPIGASEPGGVAGSGSGTASHPVVSDIPARAHGGGASGDGRLVTAPLAVQLVAAAGPEVRNRDAPREGQGAGAPPQPALTLQDILRQGARADMTSLQVPAMASSQQASMLFQSLELQLQQQQQQQQQTQHQQ